MQTAADGPNRDEVILEFYPVVQIIARRLARRLPSSVDIDELVSVGMLGLIDAVDRFDPSRGVPIKAYAEIRIKGAMLDALRQNDWVPRSIRRKNQQLEEARNQLSQTLGRHPTRAEMADQLELSLKAFDRLSRDGNLHSLLSLDAPNVQDGTPLIDMVQSDGESAEDSIQTAELNKAIRNVITDLTEKERIALSLSYLEGYTLREIGAMMGVSESRVCQIRSRAVRRIRRQLYQIS